MAKYKWFKRLLKFLNFITLFFVTYVYFLQKTKQILGCNFQSDKIL